MAGQPQRGKQNNSRRSTRSSQSTPSDNRRPKGKFSPKNSPQTPPSVTPSKVTNDGLENPELGNSERTKEEETKKEAKEVTKAKSPNTTERLDPLPTIADLNSQQDNNLNLKQKTTLKEHQMTLKDKDPEEPQPDNTDLSKKRGNNEKQVVFKKQHAEGVTVMDVECTHNIKDGSEEEIQRSEKQGERIIDKDLGEINGLKWLFSDDARNEYEIYSVPGITGYGVKIKKEFTDSELLPVNTNTWEKLKERIQHFTEPFKQNEEEPDMCLQAGKAITDTWPDREEWFEEYRLIVSLAHVNVFELPKVFTRDGNIFIPKDDIHELWVLGVSVFGYLGTSLEPVYIKNQELNKTPCSGFGPKQLRSITKKFVTEGFKSRDEMQFDMMNIIRKSKDYFSINTLDQSSWKNAIISAKSDEECHDLVAMAVRLAKTKPENVHGWNGTHSKRNDVTCLWLASIEVMGHQANKKK